MANEGLVRIGKSRRVVLPRSALEALGLEEGDLFEVSLSGGSIHLRPMEAIPRDQMWFWSPEWQAMEREVDEDKAAGNIIGPMSAEEMILFLNRDAED